LQDRTRIICALDGNSGAVILGATAIALVLYLFAAGSMPLTDPDEGRYAEISREMASGGDWLVPRLFGIPYLEKPPLLFWLTAASFRAFGATEWAARLVPASAGALGVLVVGLFAWRWFSPPAGALASVVLALSGLYFVIARTVVVDMLFTAAIAVTLCSFASWREEGPGGTWKPTVFWLSLAAATLSKGPAALVICAAVIAVDALIGRSWRWLLRPALFVPAPLLVAAALPWFLLIQWHYPQYFTFYLWKEHLQRVAGSEHASPIYWFVPWLLAGLMPWTALAIVAAPDWWARARVDTTEGRMVRFCLVWAATVFVLFSFAKGKLATYILPMFPPLAVLIGIFLDRVVRGDHSRAPVDRALLATAVAYLLGFAALAIAPMFVPTAVGPALAVILLSPLLACGLTILAWRAARAADCLWAIIATTLLFYLALAAVAPALSESFTARPLIATVGARLGPGDHYLLWGKYLPSAAFYLGRPPLLVGFRPELRFGKSLLERTPNVFDSLRELGLRTKGGRLYILTDNRKKRARELREGLGDVELVAKNYVATLWVRQ
jgi:4-amino-4-deoxy-L-arabinose transferase-like glycosyltransferase